MPRFGDGPADDAECAAVTSQAATLTARQSEYVASITSRRPRFTGPMCDLVEPALAGGLAFVDLEDEVSYGREGKVWAVAEDGVASTGKRQQAGGLRR
jgi:hypothetical protein